MLKVLALAVIAIWAAVWLVPDDKLHVVFCNVGQGDATLFIKGNFQMLVDAGPDDKVMDCLARHVPFYDRQLEVVVISHPQSDHMGGMTYVTKSYSVKYFVSDYKGQMVYAGDELKAGRMAMEVVWPQNSKVLGASVNKDDNLIGIVGRVVYGDFSVLLTADVGAAAPAVEATVLKVPHHGSKTGMTGDWLEKIKPKLAVVSVGKNTYGHPTPEALNLLSSRGIQVLRTDRVGEVEIVSDGVK